MISKKTGNCYILKLGLLEFNHVGKNRKSVKNLPEKIGKKNQKWYILFKDMGIKTQFFASKEEMDTYVIDKDYGWVSNRPFLCAGVSITSFGPKYEYHLRFNDSNQFKADTYPTNFERVIPLIVYFLT